MKMNKRNFLKSEFGTELESTIRALNFYLNEMEYIPINDTINRKELNTDIQSLFAQWEVYKLALKQFYGIEYSFTRTDDYYGICTGDEDFLFQHCHEN